MAQYRQAMADVDNSNALLAQEEQSLPVRVSGAYFEAMLTNEQLVLVLAQSAAYTAQLDAARKSFAAGVGTRTDIDEAQARLDMALSQELDARENVDYTLRQLQILVNEPIERLAKLEVSRLQLLSPSQIACRLGLSGLSRTARSFKHFGPGSKPRGKSLKKQSRGITPR